MKAGMDEHISKPINAVELLTVLERFHRSRGHAGPVADRQSCGMQSLESLCTNADAFDEHALLERLGGDKEAFKEILAMFCEHIPTLLKDLRVAVLAENWEGVARLSHSLKGASANVGAHALADLAAEMERMSRAPHPDRLHSLLSRMDLQLGAVKQSAGRLGC